MTGLLPCFFARVNSLLWLCRVAFKRGILCAIKTGLIFGYRTLGVRRWDGEAGLLAAFVDGGLNGESKCRHPGASSG